MEEQGRIARLDLQVYFLWESPGDRNPKNQYHILKVCLPVELSFRIILMLFVDRYYRLLLLNVCEYRR